MKRRAIMLAAILPCLLLLLHCSDDKSPASSVTQAPTLVVNEILADNDTHMPDPDFDAFSDWFEVYNTGSAEVDMGGMYLTDDLADTTKWQVLAGTVVPSKGYLLFWADDEDTTLTAHHTNFKLGKGGEAVGLFDTDANGNAVIDAVTFDEQETEISFGRKPDGTDNWQFFPEPTPGASN